MTGHYRLLKNKFGKDLFMIMLYVTVMTTMKYINIFMRIL